MIRLLTLILSFIAYNDEKQHREWQRTKGE